MRRKTGLMLTLVLADDSRKYIPAEWTDLPQPSRVHEEAVDHEAIGSVGDLLRARAYVDHLLRRMEQR